LKSSRCGGAAERPAARVQARRDIHDERLTTTLRAAVRGAGGRDPAWWGRGWCWRCRAVGLWSRSTGTSPRAEAVLAFFVGSVLIFLIVLGVGFFLAGS
jgi:hypothetical protein